MLMSELNITMAIRVNFAMISESIIMSCCVSIDLDLPRAVWRLATNPMYVCCVLGGSFNMQLIGLATFTPKYLEQQFGVTGSVASVYTGNSMYICILCFSWFVLNLVFDSVYFDLVLDFTYLVLIDFVYLDLVLDLSILILFFIMFI